MEFVLVNQPRVCPRRRIYSVLKRVMDMVICITTLPLVIPILGICTILIYLDDPDGSIFFIQERIGKGGRLFKMWKLRTIKSNFDTAQSREYMKAYIRGEAENRAGGTIVYKPVSTDQILRVGRFLRKTSLDELPQIINVIKGEMSIVGPRPNVAWEVDVYQPWHYERLEVLPGITGLAQVRGRSAINFNALARYDIAYIEQQSLTLDLKILIWTIKTAIAGNGAM